jgi:hypothetical protein
MPGQPYLGADNRPRTQVDWTASAGSSPKTLEFLIDTGATRSCIDLANATSMRLVGAVATRGFSATLNQSLIFGGGQMEFDIEDRASGATISVKHTGDVLLTSQRLMGADVFSGQGLTLIMDYSATPPSVRLVR